MKKLLFLLCCALLLLLGSAAPALADYYYQVDPYEGGAVWVDDSTLTWGPVDTVPALSDIRVGLSLVAITRGGAISQSKDVLFRLTVKRMDPGPASLIRKVGAAECRRYWGAPYHWNDWMTAYPELVITPYNGSQAGVWGIDWLVPMPPLTAGTYRMCVSDKVLHRIADPLFARPWEYQLVYPHDWVQYDEVTFVVE